ncbi:hypothetical protein MMC24_002351 [Lignoscripta atroalba]|nr:hypothetical protein [Lignoscripta atroalba]
MAGQYFGGRPLPSHSYSESPSNEESRPATPKWGPHSANYGRDGLGNHGYYIDTLGRSVQGQSSISTIVNTIVRKERGSPPVTDEEVSRWQTEIDGAANFEEGVLKKAYGACSPNLLPMSLTHLPEGLAMGSSTPFNMRSVPQDSSFEIPYPIIQPKPDVNYGYSADAFTKAERRVQSMPALRAHSQPNLSTFWPFFVIEFKSASHSGSTWVAANQSAASGGACVHAIDTLLSVAKAQMTPTTAVAF